MKFKYQRKVSLTLSSNSPQELNKLAYKLFRTRDKETGDKHVSVNSIME